MHAWDGWMDRAAGGDRSYRWMQFAYVQLDQGQLIIKLIYVHSKSICAGTGIEKRSK